MSVLLLWKNIVIKPHKCWAWMKFNRSLFFFTVRKTACTKCLLLAVKLDAYWFGTRQLGNENTYDSFNWFNSFSWRLTGSLSLPRFSQSSRFCTITSGTQNTHVHTLPHCRSAVMKPALIGDERQGRGSASQAAIPLPQQTNSVADRCSGGPPSQSSISRRC